MNIYWIGHSCFLIKTQLGKRILTDPFCTNIGYKPYKGDVDVVTISHMHFDHSCTSYINKKAKILTDLVSYENTFCKINSFHTFHDNCFGLKRDKNFIFKIICDDVTLCHLGDLGHLLSKETLEKLGNVDVLFVPVGEHITLSINDLKKVIDDINPKIIIPMHYKTQNLSFSLNTLDNFLMKMKGYPMLHTNFLSINKSNISLKPKVIILDVTKEDLL